MKIEVGRFYRTRDGRKAFVFSEGDARKDIFPIKYMIAGENAPFCCCSSGFFRPGFFRPRKEQHPYDLIADWQDCSASGFFLSSTYCDLSKMQATDKPKKYRLSEMWVVWQRTIYNEDDECFTISKSCAFSTLSTARDYATICLARHKDVEVIAITRADATEFTEGEGL